MTMSENEEKEEAPLKCIWDVLTECRHPEWFDTAQKFIDSVATDMAGTIDVVEHQFEKLKEGCKICLFAEMGRQLRLLSVRSQ